MIKQVLKEKDQKQAGAAVHAATERIAELEEALDAEQAADQKSVQDQDDDAEGRINTMTRPRLRRRIRFNPDVIYFKPQGVPMSVLETIELSAEEAEALRLKNIENLEQEEAAKKMDTSQSTFQRILSSAYKKISEAIIEGKAIKIVK